MKSKLLTLLLGCSFLAAHAEEIPNMLVVWTKDGSRQTFVLSEQPQVTFSSTEMLIKSSTVEAKFSLKEAARFTYERNEATQIENLATGQETFRITESSIFFQNLPAQSEVSVVSMDGKVVMRHRVVAPGSFTLPLSGLKAGAYVVKANGITSKILKK